MATDPLAALGTPAVASTQADPLASLGVPATSAAPTTDTTSQPQQKPDALTKAEDFIQGGVTGFAKHLPFVGSRMDESHATDVGPGAAPVDPSVYNAGKVAGHVVENADEWAAGDEALSGLAKLSKVPEAVLQLAEKYPTAAKLLNVAGRATKAAIIGGAQGAKEAPKGEEVEGATGGAVGGVVGSGIGEGIGVASEALAPYVKKAAQTIGAGRDAVDSLTRALRPTGNAARTFPENAKLALPRLAAANKVNPITNLDELSDAAHNTAKNLWNKEIVPQISKYAKELVPGQPVAAAIRNGVSEGDKDLFEGSTDAAEALAKKFDGDMTVEQASNRLQALNRQVQKLYKLDPATRYAATAGSHSLEAMEDAANELRQQIYGKLESLGEKDPASLRKTYGALKQVEQAANKRAIVYSRQNPINLTQILATAGGAGEAAGSIMSGHPLAALAGIVPIVVAKVAKTLNAPENLIKSAVEQGLEESGIGKMLSTVPQAAARAVSKVAPVLSGVAGSKLGQYVTHVYNPATKQIEPYNGQ